LIYGEPNWVNIYTETITYVGTDYIKYTLNSCTGCSGAVVFLLDQNQPASVQQSDLGRAVAIHSGSHPVLQDRNWLYHSTPPCLQFNLIWMMMPF